jgi:hypothetical protein
LTPASIIPVFGSQRPYADLNFAGGSFGVGGQIVSDITRLPGFTFTRASTAMFYGSNGLLQTAASGVARFAYDPVTLASQGILVEEARTNSILQSNTFNTTWSNGNITLTAGSITGPDGTASGWKFQNTLTLITTFYQSAVINATAATASVFVKVGTSATNVFVLRNVSTATDLISGTLTWATPSISGSGWSITNVGNGWYRVIGTASAGITSGDTLRFYVGHAGVLATMGEFFYGYQAQLEAGTGASSPIPTTTAAVTRAADAATLTGISVPNPHSMAAEWTPGFDDGSSFRRPGALTNSGATSEDSIYQRHSNNVSRVYTTADMDLLLGTANATTANKAAARFETNNGAGSLNGAATVAPDTSTTPTTGIDRLLIGLGVGANGPMNGTISRIRIYNRALPDAQLQSLTT